LVSSVGFIVMFLLLKLEKENLMFFYFFFEEIHTIPYHNIPYHTIPLHTTVLLKMNTRFSQNIEDAIKIKILV